MLQQQSILNVRVPGQIGPLLCSTKANMRRLGKRSIMPVTWVEKLWISDLFALLLQKCPHQNKDMVDFYMKEVFHLTMGFLVCREAGFSVHHALMCFAGTI